MVNGIKFARYVEMAGTSNSLLYYGSKQTPCIEGGYLHLLMTSLKTLIALSSQLLLLTKNPYSGIGKVRQSHTCPVEIISSLRTMLKVNTQILTTLRHRFDEQVSESDILAWLYNFEEDDWSMALTLLNQVSFYSSNRCADILEEGLRQIICKNQGKHFALVPIGGMGKSGGVMAYHLKKLMKRFSHISWSFVDIDFKFKQCPYLVILFDDFLGSGESALKQFGQMYNSFPDGSTVVCLCVAYMQKAAKLMSSKGIKVYGVEHLPAFALRRSVFGYPPRMKVVRQFASKYGELLYPKKTYVAGMDLYVGPLGYANCQSLVCFDHTTPNNTLPILWASNKRSDNGRKWIPLFPRRLFDRTRRDDSYEQMKFKWLSIAQKISMGTINRPFNDYSRSSIQLLGLLHGKYHHRSDAYICTMLEISNADYQKLCTNAKQKNLLAENGQLTSEGRKTYTSIRKVEFETKPLVEKQIDKIDYLYLPNRFLGFSKFQCY